MTPPAELLWPVGSPLSERYGPQPPAGWTIPLTFGAAYRLGIHPGIDISLPGESDLGQPVYAVAGGRVVFAGDCHSSFGNVILVEHRDVASLAALWSQYAHVKTVECHPGQVIAQGDVIGTVGNGSVTGGQGPQFSAHLHFELRRLAVSACHWPSGPEHIVSDAVRAQVLREYLNPSLYLGR